MTAIERQIAHVWAASVIGSMLLFVVEWLLGLPVLKLAPVLGLLSGMVFLVKAGMLNGVFYVQAAALVSHGTGDGRSGRQSATRSSASSRRCASSCRGGSITGRDGR